MRIEKMAKESYYEVVGENAPKNAGMRKEQIFRFTRLGVICNPDHIPHTVSADCQGVQIKSSRATIATDGLTLEQYIAIDVATEFAYVMDNEEYAVIMNRDEWLKFATKFQKNDCSNRNIIRLDRETNEVKKYFFKLFH